MTNLESLHRAILLDPADDSIRLCYADELEAAGDPRAEFVRVQMELAEIGPPPKRVKAVIRAMKDGNGIEVSADPSNTDRLEIGDRVDVRGWAPRAGLNSERLYGLLVVEESPQPWVWYMRRDEKSKKYPKERVAHLHGREQGLLLQHWQEWAPDLSCHRELKQESSYSIAYAFDGKSLTGEFQFRRGFVESIRLTQADFLKHAGAIFHSQPVTEVVLSDREPTRRTLAEMPEREEWAWALVNRNAATVTAGARGNFFIDERIGEYLPDNTPTWATYFRLFPSMEAAIKALSIACVKYARKETGL